MVDPVEQFSTRPVAPREVNHQVGVLTTLEKIRKICRFLILRAITKRPDSSQN
jgi:hypothetical protein